MASSMQSNTFPLPKPLSATRDLQDLLEKGALILLGEGGGRSKKYQVNFDF